jgi:hypothetical protein
MNQDIPGMRPRIATESVRIRCAPNLVRDHAAMRSITRPAAAIDAARATFR